MKPTCFLSIEPSIHSVWSNPSCDTFVYPEPAAFPCVRCDLHTILLNYAMHSLLA